MGSYIEHDSAQQEKEADVARKEALLKKKGYQMATIKLGPVRKFTIFLHEPCGAYVGRIAAHDKVCPAGQ